MTYSCMTYSREYRYRKLCTDITQVENYHRALADDFSGWECHHREESHDESGNLRERFVSKNELVALNRYWGLQPSALIFLTVSEHRTLHTQNKTFKENQHNGMLGHKCSDETRRKLSDTRRKLIASGWRISDEAIERANQKKRGRPAWNSGRTGIYSEETRKKMGASTRGRHWYTNGVDNVMAYECPNGYHLGKAHSKGKEG